MAKDAAQRKREQREREAQHLLDVGAEDYKCTFFRQTLEDLGFLKTAGDFEQVDEVITLLIKNATQIIKRDMSQVDVLLKVPCHKKESGNV
ncbi:MAG: hypothetical protein MJK10_03980 [Pseudomonadales bacterium]|nr:hypothetical protein [Pseudomonadales bacterium]NRA15232.1 hypothetical protein [Oceanospirillaceae bacterium]